MTRTILLALSVLLLATDPGHSAERTKPLKLLFLGDNGHHQPRGRFGQMQPVLKARGIELEYTDVAGDLNAKNLAKFDGLVLFANIDKIEDDQAKALLDYVASGKGFVPLHCASYCFRNNNDVVALMGGQFQRHGTGVFRVTMTEAGKSHPLLKGYRGFESWDETYVHTKHNEKDRIVLETRAEGDGQEPWTWVKTHGTGRVFYTAWGHDERTWGNPGFQNLVERGMRWACGDDVSQVPSFADRPEMTAPRKDVKPFEYVDSVIPFYPPSKQWGVIAEPVKKLQKPLPAEESIKHFITPIGFAVELFAADPDIGKPLAMNWDERGRLWLCETLDYPNELQEPTKGRDRIRICEDTNGDGHADKFTIFAEKLSIPTAIAFYRGGAIVQDGTQTVYLKDTNGDDKADIRKVLITGWALGDTHGGVSNFQYGLDNWYYGMQGYNNSTPVYDDGKKQSQSFRMGFFRFKVAPASGGRQPPDASQDKDAGRSPKHQGADAPRSPLSDDDVAVSDIEFLRSTNNNTWGLGISEEGLMFGSTANGNPSEFMPIPNRYYEKVRGWSASALGGIADANKIEPFSDKVRQVDHHGGFTAAAGHALYTARSWPKEYWNRTAFVCEPTGKLVSTFVLRADGAGFRSNNPWNILASDDEWSAPIMAEVGPDGQLWVIDWYNIIVQHNPTPAGYKTGKGNAYEIELRDKKHGRIYRVAWRGGEGVKGGRGEAIIPPNPNLSTVEGQLDALQTGNKLWRSHAQRLMVENKNADVLQQLIVAIQDQAQDEIGQNSQVVHALWTLQGRGALNGSNPDANKALLVALDHPSVGVRCNVLAVAPRNEQFAKAILKSGALRVRDAQVRLAALLALAEMPPSAEAAEAIRVAFASIGREDRWLSDALIMASAQHDVHFLKLIAKTSGAKLASPPSNALAIISEHYARSAPVDSVGSIIELLADAEPKDVAAIATEAIVVGLSKGWPKDKPVTLSATAETGMVKLVTTAPSSARGALVNLASRWGSKALEAHIGEIAKGFRAILSDDKVMEAERVVAARQLVEFQKLDLAVAAEIAKLITPRTSAELANGLVEAIGLSEATAAGETLIASWPTLTPTVRQTAMRGLLARADWTKSLVVAFEAGTIELSDLSLEQKQALAGHPDKELAARMKPLLAKGGGLPNPDRQRVIDELLPTIEKTGEVANGKAVFKKTCAKCHTHSGEGTKIGPDLTGMAVHPKHELIIHILDPSRSVEGNFRIYTVQTDDGKVFNGLLASESKTAIELIDSEAKKHTILRENIEELISSKKSLMPEGVEKLHTPMELRDLLEFLTQRGKFLPIPIEKYATVVSTKGMFNSEDADVERLIFPDWKPKLFEGVPFVLVDPNGEKTPNVIMLNGSAGNIPPKMPKSVTLPCNAPAKAIHFLGGISGWGWPASEKGSTCMIVRLYYGDGQKEDHPLLNGEHFADYIRRVDVPQSKFAFALRGQQARYFAVIPKRTDKIESIELVKGSARDVTSPVIMAVTVETLSAEGK